jgi:2-polyprenyl-3-methyl-5-hydroxy-6-metoxy-1,4-benzoquinol methylase
MGKLAEKRHWDSVYEEFEENNLKHKQNRYKNILKILVKIVFGKKIIEYIRNYAGYLIWDILYMKYLPNTRGAKILEIGSAPGNQLVSFNKKFGFIPYGIEYSEIGVELNKKIFNKNKLNPDNVIYGDFLSEEFHNLYKGFFDIVVSNGFIEHFTDVDEIVQKHINLLRKGGYLVIGIPNLRGFNYILKRFFYKEDLPRHNINIMKKEKFAQLFKRKDLTTLFCNYIGTFNSLLFNTKRDSSKIFVLSLLNKFQLLLNIAFRLLFKDKGAESSWFSPYLFYIGIKTE